MRRLTFICLLFFAFRLVYGEPDSKSPGNYSWLEKLSTNYVGFIFEMLAEELSRQEGEEPVTANTPQNPNNPSYDHTEKKGEVAVQVSHSRYFKSFEALKNAIQAKANKTRTAFEKFKNKLGFKAKSLKMVFFLPEDVLEKYKKGLGELARKIKENFNIDIDFKGYTESKLKAFLDGLLAKKGGGKGSGSFWDRLKELFSALSGGGDNGSSGGEGDDEKDEGDGKKGDAEDKGDENNQKMREQIIARVSVALVGSGATEEGFSLSADRYTQFQTLNPDLTIPEEDAALTISLLEANGQFKLEIQGVNDTTRMELSLTNKQNQDIIVTVPVGTVFTPQNTSGDDVAQKMMLR